MIRCLLHHDADIEARDAQNETPLLKAVAADKSLAVQVLFDNNADAEAKSTDEASMLHLAVRLQRPGMLKQILDLAPELKDAVDVNGKTALHLCAEWGLIDQATVLLAHKNHLDVNALDSRGRSALYFAASKPSTADRESLVQLLVEHGARIDETRQPPKWRDYSALRRFQIPRRATKKKRRWFPWG